VKLKSEMRKKGKNNNLIIVVLGLVICSLASAAFTAYTCDYVLDSFQSSQTMALIITDTGIKSDDAQLEHQLSQASLALKSARDFGYALAIGSGMVLMAVLVRIKRQKAL
jgi:uncharacterized transporter YbjL